MSDVAERLEIICTSNTEQGAKLKRTALEAVERIGKLEKALDDIAKGMVPASEIPFLNDRTAFRSAMWTWSQKRAREGLEE